MTQEDDDQRKKQKRDERRRDVLWEHRASPEELRRRWEARKHFELSLAVFDQVSLEIAFAERMLRDGLDEQTVVELVMALRRTDPNSVITISDEAGAHASVEIAQMKINGTI